MRQRLALVFFGLAFSVCQTTAQTAATKTLSALLGDGYEIKSFAGSKPIFFVQKGRSAFVCEMPTLPTERALYGVVLGTAVCSEVKG